MNVPALKSEVQVYNLLRQRVLDQYPGLDDETIRDTLEGITTLHELISELIRSALVDAALQAGLRTRLDEMRLRLGRLAERDLKKRQLALEAMNEVGLIKLEQPDFTATARLGAPYLVVTSERAIPENYWVPQPPKLNRQGLTSDLKRGKEIPGACLGNAHPVLVVRTK
jgi:Siphovirus Gp157